MGKHWAMLRSGTAVPSELPEMPIDSVSLYLTGGNIFMSDWQWTGGNEDEGTWTVYKGSFEGEQSAQAVDVEMEQGTLNYGEECTESEDYYLRIEVPGFKTVDRGPFACEPT